MTYAAPPPAAPTPPATPPPAARNGFGITALVLGIVGLALAWIPVIGFLGFILGALAIIFGGIAVYRAHTGQATNKIMAYFGLGLGVVAFVISLAVWVSFANEVDRQINQPYSAPQVEQVDPAPVQPAEPAPNAAPVEPDAQEPRVPGPYTPAPAAPAPTYQAPAATTSDVTYTVTSSGGEAFVTYYGDGSMSMVQEDVASGWSKTVAVEDMLGSPIASITVSPPMDLTAPVDQEVTLGCTLAVDGAVVSEQEATGAYASVTCTS